VLDKLGYQDVLIFHPSCEQGYSDFGESSDLFVRGTWRALVAADVMLKVLLKTRPYEVEAGTADRAFEECIEGLCAVLETPYPSEDSQMIALQECLARARNRFRDLAIRCNPERPLIGVVG
jgi:predicted nucleotide-binding protein (sugar kinase/HSP70/actin superfamily)